MSSTSKLRFVKNIGSTPLEVQQHCLHPSAELSKRAGQLPSKVDIDMLRRYKTDQDIR